MKSRLPILENPPSTFIDFIAKLSDILTEPNDNFYHGHFGLLRLYSGSKIDRKRPVDFATFEPLHVYSNLHDY